MRRMQLSPTAYVILGMLSFGPKSGYEIKGLVDKSTRFFWAASYGQIYPELKRLSEAGLVSATDSPQGERRRTVYELTGEGRDALHAWLAEPPEVFEVRNEGMLKLFFAGDLEPAEQVRLVRELGALHAAKLQTLREIEPHAAEAPAGFPYLVLRYGIAFNEGAVEWCEREAERLESHLAAAGSS